MHRLFTPARGQWAALLSSLLLVTACGGGGSGTAGATPGANATAFTQGTITGFGSVIVNGVRFDDSSASVSDDDGLPHGVDALRLGMRVAVDSGVIDSSTASARARALRFGGLVTGPVEAVDAAAGTLAVLGQGVDVTSTTVFDASLAGGLSTLATDAVVTVHGLRDSATGRITATRVEAERNATAYKLRGVVSALDSIARTFRIGGATVSDAAVATLPGELADGLSVRVTLATTAVAGVWQAQALHLGTGRRADAAQAHVRGLITAYTAATAFSVDGIPVDAGAASFPDGSDSLALGVQVEVQGALTHGTLVASRVALESRHRGDSDRQFELHGAINAVDASARTLLLRGVTVSHAGNVSYQGGTAADLVVGANVAVRGSLGASRTALAAVTIAFQN